MVLGDMKHRLSISFASPSPEGVFHEEKISSSNRKILENRAKALCY